MKHAVLSVVLSLGMAMLIGCGGAGQTIPLALDMKTLPNAPKVGNAPRVAVIPFEDVRSDKTAIGRHQHYVESRVDRYVPAEGTAADQITKFVVDYLTAAGFPVSLLQPGAQPAAGTADVIMTGQIESYWNDAVTRLARTEMSSKNRLRIKLTNLTDKSTTVSTVVGEGTSTVITFDPEDLAQLDSGALGQSLDRFLADLVVVDRALKPKREG